MAAGSSIALELGVAADYDDAPAGKLRLGVDATRGIFTKDELGNLEFYGIEGVEDIVGGMFVDTATIDFTYDDGAGQITADLKDGSVTTPKMGLTAGTLTFPNALNVALGTGAGTQWGTGTTQTQGWYGATPVAQLAGNSDVLAGLVTLGFRAASSNPPLNLGSGALTAGTTNVGALTASSIAGTGTVALTDTLTITDGKNVVIGTGTGTQIGTGTTQKIGFFGTTPTAQIAGSVDVLAGLVTLGFRGASSNPPLNLGTGALTAGTTNVGALTSTSIAGTGTVALTGTMTVSDGINIAVGSTTGTQIATATSQKLGFYGTTPVVQITGATDVLAGLVTLGLRAASANPPLNLGTGALTAGTTGVGAFSATSITGTGTVALTDTMTVTDAKNIAVGSTTGTKIGTATSQKLGFFNATPVVQESGSNDVLASLVTLGLRAASSNPPLNLGTGLLSAGSMNLNGLFRVDTSGRLGWNGGISTDSFAYLQGTHPNNATALYGVYQDFAFPSTTTVSGQVLRLQVKTAAAAFTMATGDAIFIATPSKGAGSAITNVTGLRIDPQSGGATTSVGARIDTSTSGALWLGGDAAGTAQSGGIVFGSARDVNLFRGGADLLQTADALTVGGLLSTPGGISTTNHITITAASNLILETTTGTKIGTATNQKLGFWNATPVIQPTRVGPIVDNVSGGGSTSPTIPDLAAASVDATAASLASTRATCASLAEAIKAIEARLSAAGGGVGITA